MLRKRAEDSIGGKSPRCQNPAHWQCHGSSDDGEDPDFVRDADGHTRCSTAGKSNKSGRINKMKKVLLAVTFVTRWLSAPHAQVIAYPHTHSDAMNVVEDYRTNWRINDQELSQFDPHAFRW
jgi:hypothetical protein